MRKQNCNVYNRQGHHLLFSWRLVVLSTCLISLSSQAAEYCLQPSKRDDTQGNTVVCCSTPTGWKGWKDDPQHLQLTQKLLKDPVTRVLFQRSVWFFPSNCVADDKFRKKGPECSSLTLEARARDSRGHPDVAQGLHDFLRELREHPPDVLDDCDPVVSRFGSFSAGNSGDLTIWQIRCRKRRGPRSPWSSSNDYVLTTIVERDVLVKIYLEALDIKDILPKVDSLRELARSVRITRE